VEILSQLDDDPAMTYEVYSGATWSHIDINMNANFFKDIALRKAWFTLINIGDITSKMFPGIEVPWKGNHFFSEASPYYVDYTSEVGYGSGDIEAARTILTEAGYTWNGDGMLVSPGGEVVKTDFLFASDNVVRTDTAALIQAYAAEIGWEVALNGVVGDELFSKIEAAEWDSCIFSWVGNPAFTGSPQQFFGSESSSNYGQFKDSAVDELIAQVNSRVRQPDLEGRRRRGLHHPDLRQPPVVRVQHDNGRQPRGQRHGPARPALQPCGVDRRRGGLSALRRGRVDGRRSGLKNRSATTD
jgi:peptide/nickel transport system substrate-binding protein